MPLSAEEEAQFAEQYTNPDITMEQLQTEWGKPSGTLYRWGFERKLKRPPAHGRSYVTLDHILTYCERAMQAITKSPVVPIKPPHMNKVGKPMDLVLWLTDTHPARRTISYNIEVYKARMAALATRLQYHTYALRQSYYYDIRKLVIFTLGDHVVGENLGRNITMEELESTVLDQVFKLSVPAFRRFTIDMLATFDEIEVHGIKGNHGTVSKFGPSQSANWDTVVYLAWEASMKSQERVTFDIETVDWYKYATVRNMEWLLVHGDQVKASGGHPGNAFALKSMRWHTSMPQPFDAVACGHFHQFFKADNVWGGPAMLSDDNWSREVLGKDGECGQLVLGITDEGIEQVIPIGLRDVGGL